MAECYRRAMVWFCGGPGAFDADLAWKPQYGGYELTCERGYLEVGRRLLVRLAASQDWSDDPGKRGAVGLSPMYLDLLFFRGALSAGGAAGGGAGGLSAEAGDSSTGLSSIPTTVCPLCVFQSLLMVRTMNPCASIT